MEHNSKINLRYNIIFNLFDGGFFGFALGFASFVTILPLFVSTLTDSAVLIGMVPAIHNMGWQLPQLLIANKVAKRTRYKPMVLFMTIHERLPFLGLAITAWFMGYLGQKLALYMTFFLLIWQGLGAGLTANAWQSMIAKIIPPQYRGTFIGSQASAANFLASISAIIAGVILERFKYPINFTICFCLNVFAMIISWIFLAQVREDEKPAMAEIHTGKNFWNNLGRIVKQENQFRWFLIVRILSQLAVMAFAFYTVFAVHELGMSEIGVGFMTSVYMGSQIIANPIMGFFGDRYNHHIVMQVGMVSAIGSAIIAAIAPSPTWFYLVFLLAGIANVSVWNTALAMTIEFGKDHEKPYYIGLANTIVAPMTMLAPIFGGWVADNYGYSSTFLTAAFGGLITVIALQILRNQKSTQNEYIDIV
jgi:MFS family permease